MMTPTALKDMRLATTPVNMNRMPSSVSRLRASAVRVSTSSVSGSITW